MKFMQQSRFGDKSSTRPMSGVAPLDGPRVVRPTRGAEVLSLTLLSKNGGREPAKIGEGE